MPAVGDVVDERLRADHERRAAAARSASRNWSAAPTVTTSLERRLEPEPPELADELLRRVADVVGEEGDPLARLAQRRDRLGRAVERLVADPEAAVEVEQHVVVAGEPE